MRFVRVQYDGYNRQFKLMDGSCAGDLEDGGTYVIADCPTQDFLAAGELELLEANHIPVLPKVKAQRLPGLVQ